jgi:hypothetical protein
MTDWFPQRSKPWRLISRLAWTSARLSVREWVSAQMTMGVYHEIQCSIGVWEAMEKLNTLVDESDPDVSA